MLLWKQGHRTFERSSRRAEERMKDIGKRIQRLDADRSGELRGDACEGSINPARLLQREFQT